MNINDIVLNEALIELCILYSECGAAGSVPLLVVLIFVRFVSWVVSASVSPSLRIQIDFFGDAV